MVPAKKPEIIKDARRFLARDRGASFLTSIEHIAAKAYPAAIATYGTMTTMFLVKLAF
jgi:hypothetical protein